ncbi:hypothetical protein V6N12_061712 [Hibiscus sabdariffa]|uniref:Uncharacterized protein n=1 Tax=Hibiscus sabdariffa TaxID=183260 RepID=A0ABR2DXU5_9ROSI
MVKVVVATVIPTYIIGRFWWGNLIDFSEDRWLRTFAISSVRPQPHEEFMWKHLINQNCREWKYIWSTRNTFLPDERFGDMMTENRSFEDALSVVRKVRDNIKRWLKVSTTYDVVYPNCNNTTH